MSEIAYTSIKQKDGHVLRLTHYICPQKPKASVLILHGMAEHQRRYQPFAEYLVNNGYDVYSYDHRGHGTERKLSELGFFGPSNGYQLVIEDAAEVSKYVEKHNRCSKFILFGHSMGSVVARNVIQTFDRFHGVILSGTPYPSKLLVSGGLSISRIVMRIKGPRHISPYLHNLMFGGRKYTSMSKRTKFDWLTRSHPVVGMYMHDPYCGYTCTASFYHDLLKLIQNASKRSQIKLTRRDLPFFIISGEKDPVTGYGREIHKYLSVLRRCDFTKVSSKLYPECRHELLNELNQDEVYSDILRWLPKN